MLRRIGLLALLVTLLVAKTGNCGKPWPCGNTYYGMQCSCLYWHEWFSHKPCCCDPCNQCGQFTQSRNPYVKTGPRYTRFGEVYSDGSGSNAPGAIGELYNGPQPTPASPPEGVMENLGPTPAEELPRPGPGPTTRMPMRQASRLSDGFYSPPASRTMGRPQRTRLFTR